MPCLSECDGMMELGPPPSWIAGMPPPPIPAFLRHPVDLLVAANGSCNLCGWAGGDDVQLVEITRKYPAIDDMWYFVITSAAIGVVLFGILIVLATLRCQEAKVKPVHNTCTKLEKGHHPHGRSVEPVATATTPTSHLPMSMPPRDGMTGPKSMWSGIKGPDNAGYSLHHHPVNHPDDLLSNYERVDYGSVGHTAGLVKQSIIPACHQVAPMPFIKSPVPPPLPVNPPPATLPSHETAPPTDGGVQIMGNGDAYYANPDSLDGSFENTGYVDDSEGSVEVNRVAPDGAVVGRRGRATPVRGGGEGWNADVDRMARQHFEMVRSGAVLAGVGGQQQINHHHHAIGVINGSLGGRERARTASAKAGWDRRSGRSCGAGFSPVAPTLRSCHTHVSSPLV